jgi:hypothetical protein
MKRPNRATSLPLESLGLETVQLGDRGPGVGVVVVLIFSIDQFVVEIAYDVFVPICKVTIEAHSSS